MLTINLWLLRLPIPMSPAERAMPIDKQPTDAQRIDGAITELTAVMRDHPENAELPFWIAQAKIGQAIKVTDQMASEALNAAAPGDAGVPSDRPADGTLGEAGGPAVAANGGAGAGIGAAGVSGGSRGAEVHNLLAEAVLVFDDPIARRPKDADLYYKKFQVLTRLVGVDRVAGERQAFEKQRGEALRAAQSLVTPADRATYSSYKSQWANYLSATDPAGAEQVFKDLLAPPGGGDCCPRRGRRGRPRSTPSGCWRTSAPACSTPPCSGGTRPARPTPWPC